MHLMTGYAAFTQGFVLEYTRSRLLTVTLDADSLPRCNEGSLRPVDRHAMRVVAVDTGNPSLPDRMMVLKVKPCPYFRVAVEACFRICPGVYDMYTTASSRFHMETARPMTHLASLSFETLRIAQDAQAGVIRVVKGSGEVFVAERAGVGTHIIRTCDPPGRRHHQVLIRRTGEDYRAQHYGDENTCT